MKEQTIVHFIAGVSYVCKIYNATGEVELTKNLFADSNTDARDKFKHHVATIYGKEYTKRPYRITVHKSKE